MTEQLVEPFLEPDWHEACHLVGELGGRVIHRLSRLGDDLSEVAELDLNPVIASPDGCVAADARVRARRVDETRRTKTW